MDPLKQFTVIPLIKLNIMGVDISFTNSSLFMTLTLLMLIAWGVTAYGRRQKTKDVGVITRAQAASELIYETVTNTISGTCGNAGLKYVPKIFTLYIFIILSNSFGLLPGGFTVTSHIIVTFALALFIFILINIIGFTRHGLHYFSILLPKGTPWFLVPLMVIIELFTYLSRPISLSLRLAANMTAGHIVLKVFASFVFLSGIAGIFPFGMLVILTGFEFFVAILQAYIFTILSCVYLNDALNMH